MPNYPGVNFSYPTGGLAVGPQEDLRNESILIIGTAEDGPTDTVVRMRSPAFARGAYGRPGAGDLLRKAEEAWYAQGGKQDIRLLRISNGRKAQLALAEASGQGVATEQPTGTSLSGQTILTSPALTAEMLYPGAKYNQATVSMGFGPSGSPSVIFYNPKTGNDSYYSYNNDPNAYADVHNVRELAAAMNADPNFSSIATAEAGALAAHTELVVDPQGTDALATNDDGILAYIDLGYAKSIWGAPEAEQTDPTVLATTAPAITGGAIPADSYWYTYSVVTAVGETNVEPTGIIAVVGGTVYGRVVVTIPDQTVVSGNYVLGFNLYRSIDDGGPGTYYKVAFVPSLGGDEVTYTDTSATTTTVIVPGRNTTEYAALPASSAGGNYAYTGTDVTTDGRLRLDLSARVDYLTNEAGAPVLIPTDSTCNGSYGGGFFKHYDNTASYISQTAGNRLSELSKVGELAATHTQILNCAGFSKLDLPYAPIVPPALRTVISDVEAVTTYTTKLRPLSLEREAADTYNWRYNKIMGRSGPSYFTVTSPGVGVETLEYSADDHADAIQIVTRGFVGILPLLPSTATEVELEFSASLPPDCGWDGAHTRDLIGERSDATTRYDYLYLDSITAYGADTLNRLAYHAGPDTITVYEVQSNGSYSDANDLGHLYEISWTDLGDGTEPKAKITFYGASRSALPADGTSIYITYKSLPGLLTQTNNLMGVMNKIGWDAWKTYFITGRRVYFAGPLPSPVQLSYNYEKTWSIGSDCIVLDYLSGTLEWSDRANQPGTAMNLVPPIVVRSATQGALPGPDWSTATTPVETPPQWSRLILYYEYDPEWVDLGATARAFQGGSDGITMDSAALYVQLNTVYSMLSNYKVDHVVLPDGAYLDAIKSEPNPITGLFESVNAGFQTQLGAFLDEVLENVHETMAYMSVTPPVDNKLATIQNWVQKLVTVDMSDPTRAANWYSILAHRLIHVFAMQPIVSNAAAARYLSDGIPSFVGTYAELPIDEGMTMHKVPGWVGLRFELSPGQLEALTAARYVTARVDQHTGGIVVTDVPTAAAVGDDYARSTTSKIVRRVCDEVRRVVSPFLGKLSEDSVYNAAATAISNVIRTHINIGSLRPGSTFSVFASPADRVRGVMNVRLQLAVNFEIRIINVVVNLVAR